MRWYHYALFAAVAAMAVYAFAKAWKTRKVYVEAGVVKVAA